MLKLTDKFTFGMYKGQVIENVAVKDPEYVLWAHNKVDNFTLSDIDVYNVRVMVGVNKNCKRRFTQDQCEDYMMEYGSDPNMWGG